MILRFSGPSTVDGKVPSAGIPSEKIFKRLIKEVMLIMVYAHTRGKGKVRETTSLTYSVI
jgi:hypothetical protein